MKLAYNRPNGIFKGFMHVTQLQKKNLENYWKVIFKQRRNDWLTFNTDLGLEDDAQPID